MRLSRTAPRWRFGQARAIDRATGLRDKTEAEITKLSVGVCRRINQQKWRQQPGRADVWDGHQGQPSD
jgi:hypothetical protein